MTRFCIRSKRRNILPSRKRFSLVFAGRKKVPRGVINWISSWVWLNLWAKEMSLDRFPRCDADIIGREGMLHWPVVRVYRSVISAFACCPYGFLMKERHMQWQHYQGQSQSITSERGFCLKRSEIDNLQFWNLGCFSIILGPLGRAVYKKVKKIYLKQCYSQ